MQFKPGASQRLTLSADLTAAASLCEIIAKSGGAILYQHLFPITVDGTNRRTSAQLRTTPYAQPFGINASWAPLARTLLVKLDRYYMPRPAEVAGGTVRLTDPETGEILVERPICRLPLFLNALWNEVTVSWQGRNLEVRYDGAKFFSATVAAPLQLPGLACGLDIRDSRRRIEPAKVTFGPISGARLDDLKMTL